MHWSIERFKHVPVYLKNHSFFQLGNVKVMFVIIYNEISMEIFHSDPKRSVAGIQRNIYWDV